MTAFEPELLVALGEAREVIVETSHGPGQPVRETIIWVVVDDADRVLVRSVRGPRGRWYRELLANPWGALRIGASRVPVRAEHAGDPDRVASCTRALEMKYRSARASLAAMVRDDVLGSTLQLTPVSER